MSATARVENECSARKCGDEIAIPVRHEGSHEISNFEVEEQEEEEEEEEEALSDEGKEQEQEQEEEEEEEEESLSV